MPDKYIIQRRTASGLENVAELPALENGKVDLSWLPVVGSMGSAIIERGSNANGEYIRWADGTQVCWASLTDTIDIVYGGEKLFRSETIWRTYPAAFIAVPTVAVGLSMINEDTSATVLCALGTVNTNSASCRAYAETSSTRNLAMHYLAIGRWK